MAAVVCSTLVVMLRLKRGPKDSHAKRDKIPPGSVWVPIELSQLILQSLAQSRSTNGYSNSANGSGDWLDDKVRKRIDESSARCQSVQWLLKPFVKDTYGGFHSGALKMLKTCVSLRAESSGGDCAEIYRNFIVKMPQP
jgi:hypothetical protein